MPPTGRAGRVVSLNTHAHALPVTLREEETAHPVDLGTAQPVAIRPARAACS
jgi:hypothetical protein